MKDRGHFYFQGKAICKQFFLFLHTVSDKVYRSLKSTLAEDGIVPKAHQNTVKLPTVRAHSLETRLKAVRFLEKFAIQHAVVLPGRVPGYKNPDLLLLPSEYTKTKVYQKYATCVAKEHFLPYSTFTELWRQLVPHICIQKPRTDLCSTCKMDTLALSKLRSLDDEEHFTAVGSRMQRHPSAHFLSGQYHQLMHLHHVHFPVVITTLLTISNKFTSLPTLIKLAHSISLYHTKLDYLVSCVRHYPRWSFSSYRKEQLLERGLIK